MKDSDFPVFLVSDDEFQRCFYIITDHARVWNWLKKINIQFDRFRFLRLKVEGLSKKDLLEGYRTILQAVQAKNINEVERLTANHIHRMLTEENSLIDAFPDYFENYASN